MSLLSLHPERNDYENIEKMLRKTDGREKRKGNFRLMFSSCWILIDQKVIYCSESKFPKYVKQPLLEYFINWVE